MQIEGIISAFRFLCLSEKERPAAAQRVSAGSVGILPIGLSLLLDGQQTSKLLQL